MLGLDWGYVGVILGLHWDNGKYNGNYYHLGLRVWGLGFRLGAALTL